MKAIEKPCVMARFGINTNQWSDYGHVIVSFSYVASANYYDTPRFMSYSDGLPLRLQGISDLLITSQVSAETLREKGLIHSHYGYEFAVAMNEPSLGRQLDAAIRAGKNIQRKVDKLCEEEGYHHNYEQYLRYVFRAIGVKYITHESYSEKHYRQKWKGYTLAAIPEILERCSGELIETLRWPVEMDKTG